MKYNLGERLRITNLPTIRISCGEIGRPNLDKNLRLWLRRLPDENRLFRPTLRQVL